MMYESVKSTSNVTYPYDQIMDAQTLTLALTVLPVSVLYALGIPATT